MTWPDPHATVLPSLAYLRSVKTQTIPARRLAIRDSLEHARNANEEPPGYREMAFLGVVADVMQLLEDLAYVGEGFSRYRFNGLPFYVAAIAYDGRGPTRFYQRKRTDRDLQVLLGMVMRSPDGEEMHLLDASASPLTAAAQEAWDHAEHETVIWLRAALDGLGETWQRFSPYFQSFKHGGLLINGSDVELVADDGSRRQPSLGVWRTRKPDAQGHGITTDPEALIQAMRELELDACIALEVLSLLVDNRIDLSEQAAAGPPEGDPQTIPFSIPSRIRYSRDAPPASVVAELEALGVRFSTSEGPATL